MKRSPLGRITRSAERGFYRARDEDGLPDLFAGLGLAIFGILTLAEQRLLRGLLSAGFAFGGQWLIGKAKSRIYDRRTGFGRPRRPRGDD